VHHGALCDRHLRLRDGAVAGDVDRRPAEEVQDPPRAALESLAADADEIVRVALEPRRQFSTSSRIA
jgi:hypothetical protein